MGHDLIARRVGAPLVGMCAVFLTALPVNADTDTIPFTKDFTSDSGSEIEVGHFSLPTGSKCIDQGVKIKIVKPPEHGKVSIRTGEYQYGKGSQYWCQGKTVSGSFVYYKPEAGYSGADHFEYTVEYVTQTYDETVNVTVT